jgi:hypothetical protein
MLDDAFGDFLGFKPGNADLAGVLIVPVVETV